METKMIATPNAYAFLPRSVAPTAFRFQGIALPIGGGSALEAIGGSKRRTATDLRTYLIWTPMI